MSGRVGDLSPEQEEKLEEFRNAVDDILRPDHNDYFLLRWLRARNFNVKAAEAMLRANLQWRRSVGADSVLEEFEPPEVLKKYFPGGLIGHDKEGCPLWIIPYGNLDMKGMCYSVKKHDFIKYVVMFLEKSEEDMKEQSEQLGRIIESHIVVFDLENFSMKQVAWKPAMDMILHLVKMYEANYPERLKRAYVINTPKFFPIVYAMIKPFLSEETVKKLKMCPKGRDTWKAPLLEEVDPSELPQHWGGTKVDENGDPKCSSIICQGGPIPGSYYTAPSRRLSTDQNLKTAVVEKKSTFPVELTVTEPGSVIHWEFKTENYDIGFGVFRRKEVVQNGNESSESAASTSSEDDVVLPLQRVNCHLVPEDGMIICDVPGTYILKFDNTFSWCRGKKIMYNIQVMPPSSSQEVNNHAV